MELTFGVDCLLDDIHQEKHFHIASFYFIVSEICTN